MAGIEHRDIQRGINRDIGEPTEGSGCPGSGPDDVVCLHPGGRHRFPAEFSPQPAEEAAKQGDLEGAAVCRGRHGVVEFRDGREKGR